LNLAETFSGFVPDISLLKLSHEPVCHASSLIFPSITIFCPHSPVTVDGAGVGVNVLVAVEVLVNVNVGVIVGLGPVVLVRVAVGVLVLVRVGVDADAQTKFLAGESMLFFTKFPAVVSLLSLYVPPHVLV